MKRRKSEKELAANHGRSRNNMLSKKPLHMYLLVCVVVVLWGHQSSISTLLASLQDSRGRDENRMPAHKHEHVHHDPHHHDLPVPALPLQHHDLPPVPALRNFPKPSASSSSTATATARMFAPAPEELRKLFWIRKEINHKLYEPVIRAFHSRGYSLTQDYERAHMLWSDHPYSLIWNNAKPWQRNNWIPDIAKWDDKDSMAFYMNEYFDKKGVEPLHSFPETYLLHNEEDFPRFQKRLRDGGINEPWVLKQPTVNQGKGVEIVGPNSEQLQTILEASEPSESRRVAQKYICNENTFSGRKYDFRIFWMVASVDPLIVLYQSQHNYVRIGHAEYDESDFSNTKSHLTTHTFGADEGKATWDEFKIFVEEFHKLHGDRLAHIKDPFQHLENQVKKILSTLADAFKDMTYHTRGTTADNAYTWHAADLILDNDLDVYLIEGTDGPGKDEDYDFRIVMHDTIFGDLIDIVEEVTRRQELGLPLDVEEMEKDGILGSYEVVYNDGWMFDYSFDRPPKIGCSVSKKEGKDKQIESPPHLAATARAKASLAALPKLAKDAPLKTFYMESRTGQGSEPIARSLRSKGWVPVDDEISAQLVYFKDNWEEIPKELKRWQFINQFPHENDFITVNQKSTLGRACDPFLYNGRPFQVTVYWLVLSLDPFIVFYHDGFLNIPYDENDEDEFLPGEDSDSTGIWRGSWAGFDHTLIESSSTKDPMAHVKGQMKKSLVGVAKDFKKKSDKKQNTKSAPNSFGIYKAGFKLDENLNVLDPRVAKMKIYSEGYEYLVDMHNDLFGSAFNLVEKLNATSADFQNALNPVRGDYEILIDGDSGWEFEYSWDQRAKQCDTN